MTQETSKSEVFFVNETDMLTGEELFYSQVNDESRRFFLMLERNRNVNEGFNS